MKIANTSTPVVVLHCGLGALGIMRTLGSLGVNVFGVTDDRKLFALRSRYCRASFYHPLDIEHYDELFEFLRELNLKSGERPILIATSDETAVFVAEYHERLSESFLIGQNNGSIVARLADKMTMFDIAQTHGIPVPNTFLPANLTEARQHAKSVSYPVMLKGAMGNRLFERVGRKMVVAQNERELLDHYVSMEDQESPNLMIQELIPGDDDQVFIFNGYFDKESRCLAGFTGRKIRQFPIHTGCASLGECCWIRELAEQTTSFMKEIGYRGILDIGYRKDPRDGKYKVLDINPRVGQAFRLFVSEGNVDVVRALYLDLTEQDIPEPVVPREGRRWMIEDYDFTSSYHYYKEGSLRFVDWIKSFRRVEECAWFSWKDPMPFVLTLKSFAAKFLKWIWKLVARQPSGAQRKLKEANIPASQKA